MMAVDDRTTRGRWRGVTRVALLAVGLALVGLPVSGAAQTADICGCIGHLGSLGHFDTNNQASWPPGTTRTGITVTIPLPPDGIMIFDSFTVRTISGVVTSPTVRFTRNAANTPVMLLVAGDVSILQGSIDVGGDNGTNGTSGVNGQGGLGGPGGFAGGNGAYQIVNFAADGGPGLGPGGGAAGVAAPLQGAGSGTFFSSFDLLPLVGGAGGGGGASSLAQSGCSAGGGGGGGGALLIAANGTVTVNTSGGLNADGGIRGVESSASCASRGGGGSGGAIRVLAHRITGSGSLFARGGAGVSSSTPGGPGTIRMEAFFNDMSANATNPIAARAAAPGALTNPFTPTVAITSVAGQPVTAPAQGNLGGLDVIVPSPGLVAIGLATAGVPGGTIVDVSVKPRVGGPPLVLPVTLDPGGCNTAGACAAAVAVDLPSGAYVIEARATFQRP